MKLKENVKKIYPNYEEKQIKEQIKIFHKTINEISKEINVEIKDLLFETIEKTLKEKLPSFSDTALNILFENYENIDKEDEKINEIINKETNYNLLRPDYLKNKSALFDFTRTATSIGVGDKYIKKSSDIENFSENENSKRNFKKNYKNYLGEKLLMTSEEIEKNSIESIDLKFNRYLSQAKEHINNINKNINGDSQKFKSESYTNIHSSETIFDLFEKFYELERKTKEIKEKNNFATDFAKYKNELKQIEIGKFEIQRIFALVSIYINKDATLSSKHEKEEGDFLISQIINLGTDEIKDNFLTTGIETDNKLHNYTIKKDYFWSKNKEGDYVFSNENIDGGLNEITFDSFELEGKERDYQKEKTKIDVLHMQCRVAKNGFSTVEKFLRKEHISLKEILDEKGFIFVVENYKEGKKLLKILENELGTLRTSWSEEPVFMSENGNENSNGEYNSLKGILKVPYKAKKINQFFNLIEKIPGVRRINDFFPLFKELKEKFYDKKYFIEVEIQVFDKKNYIKAEIDKKSPAYHGDYKEKQEIKNLPLYFPKEIYGEDNLKNIVRKNLKKFNLKK